MDLLPTDLTHIVYAFIHKHRLTKLILEFKSLVYNDCCNIRFSGNCRVCNGCGVDVVKGIKYNYRIASNLETRIYNITGRWCGAYLPSNYM